MISQTDKNEEHDDEMHNFWKQRMKYATQFGIVVNIATGIFQIGAIYQA